jgi:very-short-patch-repair endonuclease
MSKNKNYQRSKEHLENWLKAGILGREKLQELKQKRIEEYDLNPKKCKNCNNVFDYKHRHSTFCSKSCANSFNNKKRILTENTKEKIRKSIIKLINEGNPPGFIGYRYNKKIEYKPKILHIKICPICKKEYNTFKEKQVCCSKQCAFKNMKCSESVRKKISDKVQERIKNGTFSGWKSRKDKEPSYPEKYFISLFENEKIDGWIRDYKIGRWFVDFAFIDKKFALEIDGKQHEERKEQDKIKDDYLEKNDWKVIRIKWYNPVNENNKEKLYKQIEELKTIL